MSRFVDFKAVKAAVSMLQVLERYGLAESFKRSGHSLSGPCPLHQGQNRTQFRVSLEKNCWNCFGACQCGGNVLDFVARKENATLREAALLLCEWFQLPVSEKPARPARDAGEPPTSEAPPKAEPRPKATKSKDPSEEPDTPNKPLGFALQNLDTAHPYLTERGLTAETIAEFGLGYCQKGSMTGRIVIPIHNAEGQLVAYAGRWPGTPPDEDRPKYKLPPGFGKSREVFNYHRAIASEQEAPLLVVEGFFAAIKLHQAGYERVVALMGSSLSAPQLEMLCRLCEGEEQRLVLFFDNDEAGRQGQQDALRRLSQRLYVNVITLPGGQIQPEDVIDEWRSLLPFPRGTEPPSPEK